MIEIKDIKFGYHSSKLLFEGLNIKLKTNRIVGLLGRNGAGKTTLLRLICGLLFPSQGECMVNGKIAAKRQPKFLQEIYFIPEEFYLPNITPENYLRLYSPFYQRFDREIFNKVFRAFSLPTRKKLGEFSYGLKKKFLVAFGLATNCEVLVLDEPTNGLDIPGKAQFRRILASMLDKNKTFVIATHQVKDVEKLVDSIVVLEEGRIIFQQRLEEIAQKIIYMREADLVDRDKILYKEKILGGTAYLVENNSGIETEIDLEILFNAIIGNTRLINSIFEAGEKYDEK